LDEKELDKLCNQVMRGNTKTVKKIIYKYIRTNTERKSQDYFYQFRLKKNRRFLNKLSIENIQRMISMELDRSLKHDFRNNKSNLKFQKVVSNAIETINNCPDDRVVNCVDWIKSRYQIVQTDEIGLTKIEYSYSDHAALFRKKLINKKLEFSEVARDVFELVDHLDYIQNLKAMINESESSTPPIPPNGTVDMYEYTDYLQQTQIKVEDLKRQLNKYTIIVERFLKESSVPERIKEEVKKNKYQIKSKKSKLFVLELRKQFERFIIDEKYGEVKDTFWKTSGGAMKLVRSPAVCLDYVEENASLDLSKYLFNQIRYTTDDKEVKDYYDALYKQMVSSQNIKIIKEGKIRGVHYIVYDYIVPSSWLDGKDKWFDEIANKLDEKDLAIEEYCDVEYSFPYFGFYEKQGHFANNLKMFLNKIGVKGLSERKAEGEEYQYVAINPYQIYYPSPRHPVKRKFVEKEVKRREYYKIYSCFHHRIILNDEAELLKGGNIFRKCLYESGSLEMDCFISDIDARSGYLEHFASINSEKFKLYFESFFKDVLTYYSQSNRLEDLYLYLKKLKYFYKENIRTILNRVREISRLKKQIKKYHGNSRKHKVLKSLIQNKENRLPNEEFVDLLKENIRFCRLLRRELIYGIITNNKFDKSESKGFFKRLMQVMAKNYCESQTYRRIRIQRSVVSYCKVMANNLNIKGVVKIYRSQNDEFIRKFYHQYKKNEVAFDDILPSQFKSNDVKWESCKLSNLIKCLLDVAVKSKDRELFEELFDLLYQAELEHKEKLLLSEYNSI